MPTTPTAVEIRQDLLDELSEEIRGLIADVRERLADEEDRR
jgi:hypothetical protein